MSGVSCGQSGLCVVAIKEGGGEMRYKEEIEVLHETECPIKGNEPFLSFGQTGMIVNLHDRSGRSHNFLDGWVAGASIPISRIKKGDILRFQLYRVYQVPTRWYERVWDWIRSFK